MKKHNFLCKGYKVMFDSRVLDVVHESCVKINLWDIDTLFRLKRESLTEISSWSLFFIIQCKVS